MKINEFMAVAGLLLILFIIMIYVGVIYIGAGYLKETTCEQVSANYTWDGSDCLKDGVATDVEAITKIEIVEATIDIVLGLLALLVVVAMFFPVISIVRKFGKSNE